MTIDEAIKHAKEVAGDRGCTECAKEIAKQLASWLEELKEMREKSKWIPANRPPEDDRYILLSFDDFTICQIGRYERDEDGSGAYYPDDDNVSCCSIGIFVNAWMPLPEPYKEGEDE